MIFSTQREKESPHDLGSMTLKALSLPLVSVVIPTFNDRATLPGTVESVLSQSYKNLEIIIVDDAGTESVSSFLSPEIPGLTIYRHDSNRGVAAARNTGYANCNGAYILFLDADDKIYPDFIEHAVRALQDMPDLSSYWGGFDKTRELGPPLSQRVEREPTLAPEADIRMDPEQAVNFYLENTGRVLFSFSLIAMPLLQAIAPAGDICEVSLRNNQDFHFFVRAAARGHVLLSDRPAGLHLLRENSLSRKQIDAWMYRAKAIGLLLQTSERMLQLSSMQRRKLARMRGAAIRRRARIMAGAGQKRSAIAALIADLFAHPDGKTLLQIGGLLLGLERRNADDTRSEHRIVK